jgi:4-amino-4-deoxy-L-arabinose transferase-like glycosyltransferase
MPKLIVRKGKLLIILGLLLLGYFSLYYKLGYENVNVDQFLWYSRTQKFFTAISQGRLADTYQQYHPGVLLMYLIGLGQISYRFVTKDPSVYPDISYLHLGIYNFFTKVFVVTFSIVAILISAYMLKRITQSAKYSYIFILVLLSEPYYTGVLRNLHLDGLVSVLIFSTAISFYLACSLRSLKYIFVSGLLMGLGLLTKSVSLFAVLFCFATLLLFIFRNRNYSKWFVKAAIVWVFTALAVFTILFPAMWVEPVSTIKRIIIDGVLETGTSGGFTHVVNNISTRDPGPLFYPLVLKFRLTPLLQITSLGYLGLTLISIVRRKKLPSALFALSFAIVIIYLIIFTLASKKTDRYVSPVFPFLVLNATYVLIILYNSMVTKHLKKLLCFGLVALVSIYGAYTLVTITPYGMAYYNLVWGGINKAKKQIYLNQGGIGLFDVASYLNGLELPESTVVAATNNTELRGLIKYRTSSPQPEKKKEYKLVVLPLQKDLIFKNGRKPAYKFSIQGQTYWDVYYRDIAINPK